MPFIDSKHYTKGQSFKKIKKTFMKLVPVYPILHIQLLDHKKIGFFLKQLSKTVAFTGVLQRFQLNPPKFTGI